MINKLGIVRSISLALAVLLLALLPSSTPLSLDEYDSAWSSKKLEQFIQIDLADMIDSLRGEAHTIDIKEEDIADFVILDPVSFIDLDSVGASVPNVIHFPLVNTDGVIFAIFSVGRSETGYGRNFGQGFSRILESARLSGVDEVFLYQDGWNLHAYDPLNGELHSLAASKHSVDELLTKIQTVQSEYDQAYNSMQLR